MVVLIEDCIKSQSLQATRVPGSAEPVGTGVGIGVAVFTGVGDGDGTGDTEADGEGFGVAVFTGVGLGNTTGVVVSPPPTLDCDAELVRLVPTGFWLVQF